MNGNELYNFLIQKSIENYMQYRINYEKIEIHSILSHFSKVRNIIAKIMFSINNSLKEDTFCKKEDIEDFGKWRNTDDHDFLITPFYGKYNNIVDMYNYLKHTVSLNNFEFGSKLESVIESPNVVIIKKMYKSDPSIKIIQNDEINGNLSILYYERDDNLIKSVEDIYPRSDIVENSLLYRCVFHTESKSHLSIINHINKLVSTFSNDDKDSNSKNIGCLIEIFWFMSQASFFYRGSASISEMVLSVLYNVVRNKGKMCLSNEDKGIKIYATDISYGSDVHAIVNDLESFKIISDKIIKLDQNYYISDLNESDFSINDLENFAKNVEYKSKNEVKDILYKIIYEKRNLKDATIIYKQISEANSLINSLIEEFN